jgi:hypothetical protein
MIVAPAEERIMTDLPLMWPYSLFFAPRELNQPINPGWSFGGITVNYAGNPSIERDVIEKVASYGKQLGIITDAVLQLAGDKRTDGEDPLARLREIAAKIEALKNENKASLADEARRAMERLAKSEPAIARRIATDYARTKPVST